MTKKNKRNTKDFFCFLGPTRITPCSYISPFIIENQDHVVLYEKLFEKNNLFEDVDITRFYNSKILY